MDAERLGQMRERVAAAVRDVNGAVELLWHSASVRARFDDIGVIAAHLRQPREVNPPLRLTDESSPGGSAQAFVVEPDDAASDWRRI